MSKKFFLTLGLIIALLSSQAGASVVAHWTFDEGGGTTAADSVGGYDGTLINALGKFMLKKII